MERREISVFDVANYFLSKQEMTPKKLQKMCYYAYAWYLTMYNKELFDNGKFKAWVHGPVNVELYHEFKQYGWTEIPICNEPEFCNELKEFLDVIFNTFSHYTGNELEAMTHQEEPWIEARRGFEPEEPCNVLIKDSTIRGFYGKMSEQNQVE